ncbi:type II secretion system minor pseudopilin GspK [Methylosoma difficile]
MMAAHIRQQGIALITVLLVLAIATVVLVSMSTSRQLDIRRTDNLMTAAQAFEQVYNVETWAKNVLQADGANNKSDSFEDPWTEPLSTSTPHNGQLTAHISDLQGRFNLNNLLVDNEVNERDVKRFKRLLSLLDIEPQLVDALLDWQDGDSNIRFPEGAEDETYLREQPPYRSANRMLADVSELLLIKGISREDYTKLLPYVYVSPQYAAININTADPLILQSLAEKITEEQAQNLAKTVSRTPFTQIREFLKLEGLAGKGINEDGLTVISNHFLLSCNIKIGRLSLQFDSQFNRLQSGQTLLVKRQRRSPVNG